MLIELFTAVASGGLLTVTKPVPLTSVPINHIGFGLLILTALALLHTMSKRVQSATPQP